MKKENMYKNIQLQIIRNDTEESYTEGISNINIEPSMSYDDLKQQIMLLLNISNVDDKILKLRNSDGMLIPFSSLLENKNLNQTYKIEITTSHQNVPVIHCESPVNSVYIDTVRLKLRKMESRISRVESIIPQLRWRRQSLVEHTTFNLGSKIAFLDKRIEELIPPQWNQHLSKSAS